MRGERAVLRIASLRLCLAVLDCCLISWFVPASAEQSDIGHGLHYPFYSSGALAATVGKLSQDELDCQRPEVHDPQAEPG